MTEVTFVFRQDVIGDPHGRHVKNFDVAQGEAAAGERLDELGGLGAAVVNVDAVTGLDRGERFIGGDDAGTIIVGHGRLPRSV